MVDGRAVSELDVLRAVYREHLLTGKAPPASTVARGIGGEQGNAAIRSAIRKRLLQEERVGPGKAAVLSLTSAGRRKLKVVMIGGAFEIIHPGHIITMTEAKDLGNTLVVVVATDESVVKNKGRQPITTQEWRVRLVSALKLVDVALPGNRGSIYDILSSVRPDVVAIGYDQRHNTEEIEKEAAKRGINLTAARLDTPLPEVKTSKILLSL